MKKKNKKKRFPSPVPSPPGGEGGLRGKKILITRARDQSAEFATNLKNLGAEVIEYPTIQILPPYSWKRLDQAIDQLKAYEWIIFTSVNGVNFFFQRLEEKRRDHSFSSQKIIAIGPATAKKLREKGIRVTSVPKEFVAEGILKSFEKKKIQGKRILLARAMKARDVLPKGLRKMGAVIDVIEAYRTVKPRGGSRRLRQLLLKGGIDAITFTSSSTVDNFVELLKGEDLKKLLKKIAIACIGPVTAKTAKQWAMRIQIQPKKYTIPALTRAMVEYFSPHASPLPRGERVGERVGERGHK